MIHPVYIAVVVGLLRIRPAVIVQAGAVIEPDGAAIPRPVRPLPDLRVFRVPRCAAVGAEPDVIKLSAPVVMLPLIQRGCSPLSFSF
jgi:hypothetical protein